MNLLHQCYTKSQEVLHLRKAFWKMVLFPGLLMMLLVSTAYGRVELQVEIGFNGKYLPDQTTPIRVLVTNQGAPIQGKLTVSQSLESPWRGVIVESSSREITLDFNARKVFYFQFLIHGFVYPIVVSLTDERGTVISKEIRLRDRYQRDLMTLALSEVSFPTVLPNGEWVETIGPDRLPEEWIAYQGVGRIYLGHLLTSSLTIAQQEALKRWVVNGGELIILSGDHWYFQQSSLIDGLSPFAVQELIEIGSGTLMAAGTVKAGAEVALEESTSGRPILVEGRYGNGFVRFVTINPLILVVPEAEEEEASKITFPTESLWDLLSLSTSLKLSETTETESEGDAPNLSLEATLDFSENPAFVSLNKLRLERPTRFRIGGLVAIYIVGIGLLNWLVERNVLRSRFFGWTALIWVGVLSSLLAGYVHQPRFSNPVRILEMGIVERSDDGMTLDRTWMGIFSETKADLELVLNLENGQVRQLLPQDRADHLFDVEYRMASGENQILFKMAENQRRYFFSERFIELPVTFTFSLTDRQIRIENRSGYALNDAGLLQGNRIYQIGSIPPESSVSGQITRPDAGYLGRHREDPIKRELLEVMGIDGSQRQDQRPLLIGWISESGTAVEEGQNGNDGGMTLLQRLIGPVSGSGMQSLTAIRFAVIEATEGAAL